MNKVFEKIVKRLEEKENESILKAPNTGDFNNPDYQKWMMKSFGFKESAKIVQEVAEEYKDGWIPCSERMPEERINPVTQDYYQYPVMFRDDGVEDIKYYYFGNGHWRYGLQIMDDYVTHWMDMYQPKGE